MAPNRKHFSLKSPRYNRLLLRHFRTEFARRIKELHTAKFPISNYANFGKTGRVIQMPPDNSRKANQTISLYHIKKHTLAKIPRWMREWNPVCRRRYYIDIILILIEMSLLFAFGLIILFCKWFFVPESAINRKFHNNTHLEKDIETDHAPLYIRGIPFLVNTFSLKHQKLNLRAIQLPIPNYSGARMNTNNLEKSNRSWKPKRVGQKGVLKRAPRM